MIHSMRRAMASLFSGHHQVQGLSCLVIGTAASCLTSRACLAPHALRARHIPTLTRRRQIVSVIVAHDLRAGEFVAQIPFFPPLQSPADFPPHECARLLAAAAGPGLSGAAPQGEGR